MLLHSTAGTHIDRVMVLYIINHNPKYIKLQHYTVLEFLHYFTKWLKHIVTVQHTFALTFTCVIYLYVYIWVYVCRELVYVYSNPFCSLWMSTNWHRKPIYSYKIIHVNVSLYGCGGGAGDYNSNSIASLAFNTAKQTSWIGKCVI